ncbi:unnamed protein product [Rotaria sp. Silwood2]|nr:unnamed protein product [Rotaria sp. Silwood2]
MPPPEIQQWFMHTAQRFENKPLSGTVLKDFSRVLKLPVNVFISLKQNTGTLTARSIVRHLFPSKSRTTDDMTDDIRQSILAMPPPEIQQWFVHTAQRFENKPLSGTVLKDFSRVLKLPVNVLISLKQNTGTLTARSVVRHLFLSKSRTTDDMTDDIRQSILDFVKYCHPNELFFRGKINEASNGPFRTAKFKALHSANV